MPAGSPVCRFGPFALDASRRRLTRGGSLVPLPNRQMDVLLVLTAHAGHLVSKGMLSDAVWVDSAVTDNSIVQAVRGLRQTLGCQPGGEPYIESRKGKGYRFIAPVEREELAPVAGVASASPTHPRQATAEAGPAGAWPSNDGGTHIHALLEPYAAFVDGRAALETLDRREVVRVREAIAEVLRIEPGFPAAHIAMANACFLAFESTRADAKPDRAALAQAEHHAREACRLDRLSGDAWSTLAVVLHRSGATRKAIAAARKAVALEPEEWRQYLRLASGSWGADCLRAANRVLQLCPGLALGHWFAATVFVAREALDAALEHLRAGCAAQDAQQKEGGRFAAVGLHLLHGLVLAAMATRISPGEAGAALLAQARAELLRELEFEAWGHVYARECCANAWCALGALSLRANRRDEARAAFHEALARVPGHALATVGLAAASSVDSAFIVTNIDPANPDVMDKNIDRVNILDGIVRAAALTLQGKHREAAELCGKALIESEPGSAGWLLPVEPLLQAAAHRELWAQALAILRDRAA